MFTIRLTWLQIWCIDNPPCNKSAHIFCSAASGRTRSNSRRGRPRLKSEKVKFVSTASLQIKGTTRERWPAASLLLQETEASRAAARMHSRRRFLVLMARPLTGVQRTSVVAWRLQGGLWGVAASREVYHSLVRRVKEAGSTLQLRAEEAALGSICG